MVPSSNPLPTRRLFFIASANFVTKESWIPRCTKNLFAQTQVWREDKTKLSFQEAADAGDERQPFPRWFSSVLPSTFFPGGLGLRDKSTECSHRCCSSHSYRTPRAKHLSKNEELREQKPNNHKTRNPICYHKANGVEEQRL